MIIDAINNRRRDTGPQDLPRDGSWTAMGIGVSDFTVPLDKSAVPILEHFGLDDPAVQDFFKEVENRFIRYGPDSYVFYQNQYNPFLGTILAKDNHGLRQHTNTHWSDMVFPTWKEVCSQYTTAIHSLSYVIRLNVVNPATRGLIDELVPHDRILHEDDFEFWEFHPDDDGFYALLQSPNGVGPAYLLIDYPTSLGLRRSQRSQSFQPITSLL